MAALVPVALLSASSIILASHQVTEVVDKQVQSTAAVSSVVIGEQTSSLVALVHSYATRPSLIAGMSIRSGANPQVAANLASLARALPGISASFVADTHGTSRNTYPYFPAAIGTNFAYREWFKGLVASGRPYVSSAIVTKEASHTLAITVTDFIRGANGRPIGVLGVNYSLESITSFAQSVGQAQGIRLRVTDRLGTSLTAGGAHGLVSIANDPRVRAARAGRTGLADYAPLLADGNRGPKELSAYAPVAGTGWTVIASIPKHIAFAGLVRLRTTVLAITALLVLILLAGVRLFARSDRRRRRLEHGLLESQKLESLGVLAGGIAHNFNNLLHVMLGSAERALGKLPPDSPARPAVEQIEVAGARAAELARDMLAYSGMGVSVVGVVDLPKLVEETGRLVSAVFEAPIEITYRFEEGLPPIVADATQIRQIVLSLVTNAVEALGAAGGSIQVRADVVDESPGDGFRLAGTASGPFVRLEIEDGGAGMNSDTLERLFEPFFTTKFTGRGLGLAAVLGIVRSHSGGIRVTSEVGVGTVASLLFPCAA